MMQTDFKQITLEAWECKLVIFLLILSYGLSEHVLTDKNSWQYKSIDEEIILKAESRYYAYIGEKNNIDENNLIMCNIKALGEYIELRLRGDIK